MWLDTFGIQERKFTRLKSYFCKCRSRVRTIYFFSRSKVEFVKYVLRIYFKKFEWVVTHTTRQKKDAIAAEYQTHTRICLQAFSFFTPKGIKCWDKLLHKEAQIHTHTEATHTLIVFCYQNQVSEWLRYPKRFFAKFLF